MPTAILLIVAAAAAACAALGHREELMAQVASLRDERDATVTWLRSQGLTAYDSDANFVLFGHLPDRHAVFQALLGRGVLVREVGPEGCLRVSVGTPGEMALFRDALVGVLDDVDLSHDGAPRGGRDATATTQEQL